MVKKVANMIATHQLLRLEQQSVGRRRTINSYHYISSGSTVLLLRVGVRVFAPPPVVYIIPLLSPLKTNVNNFCFFAQLLATTQIMGLTRNSTISIFRSDARLPFPCGREAEGQLLSFFLRRPPFLFQRAMIVAHALYDRCKVLFASSRNVECGRATHRAK